MTDDDPDLDDIPRAELGEIDAAYPVVLDCLDSWTVACDADPTGHHLGAFLETLAAAGYRVTPIPDPGLIPPA